MSGKRTIVVAIALAIAGSACATHKIRYTNTSVAASGTTQSARQSFFAWGLIGGSEVDFARLCPSGVASVESKKGVGDHVLTWLTGGLYSPMSVDVQCASRTIAVGGEQ